MNIQTRIFSVALFVITLLSVESSEASERVRSAAAVRAFKHTHICPSTKTYSLRCPGYVVDHIDPLCHGGADAPSNMQYQTIEAGKQKDKLERLICRTPRRYK